ncbi:hypothetical protein [Hymenobacter sp. YC55]|uniref:hypothetical protein n=1 Tax=Hymenobacter sp. YC55 TaxID=3034019 RepID=UPI0023F82121|nr:hypothetical protein [Hymenobacter sp. YC55]MDF7813915.1 hypothetical protein [Hymenobacter sp. YC55]
MDQHDQDGLGQKKLTVALFVSLLERFHGRHNSGTVQTNARVAVAGYGVVVRRASNRKQDKRQFRQGPLFSALKGFPSREIGAATALLLH